MNQTNKEKYGEVLTPYSLINELLDQIPSNYFRNSSLWLDPAAGTGNFGHCLLERGINKSQIINVEINNEHEKVLKDKFTHVIIEDFLNFSHHCESKFDIVLGNPPYNSGGLVKVPTNNSLAKKNDGVTLWREIMKKAFSLVKENGYLCFIIPALWMKPDKFGMYEFITRYNIHYLSCLTNTQSNFYFNKQAQTPISLLILQKKVVPKPTIRYYDRNRQKLTEFTLEKNEPLPLRDAELYLSLLRKREMMKNKCLFVKKTTCLSKHITKSDHFSHSHPHEAIKTCKLRGKREPYLVVEFTSQPAPYYGIPKVVLAHKMYGFPFFDCDGKYGISTRDNYVFSNQDYTLEQLQTIYEFLSSRFALYCFEMTRYRMSYLEKYIFEIIPDISTMNMEDFDPYKWLELSTNHKDYIETFHNEYKFFTHQE